LSKAANVRRIHRETSIHRVPVAGNDINTQWDDEQIMTCCGAIASPNRREFFRLFSDSKLATVSKSSAKSTGAVVD